MRVISGTLKGRSFNFIKNTNTRPLKDIVKENIFNILIHSNFMPTKFDDYNVLDLYSGVGSFGIECISRGAKKVTFIEDVISTGGAVTDAHRLATQEGADIPAVVCAIWRGKGSPTIQGIPKLPVYPVFTRADLES